MEVRGRDLGTGLPKTIHVTSNEIGQAMSESINKMVDIVRVTLEKTPPELASDIMAKGIVLAGGGALIKDIDKLISMKTEIPVCGRRTIGLCSKRNSKNIREFTRFKNCINKFKEKIK